MCITEGERAYLFHGGLINRTVKFPNVRGLPSGIDIFAEINSGVFCGFWRMRSKDLKLPVQFKVNGGRPVCKWLVCTKAYTVALIGYGVPV